MCVRGNARTSPVRWRGSLARHWMKRSRDWPRIPALPRVEATNVVTTTNGEGPQKLGLDLRALFLPANCTSDYLPYQLATLPVHVTGWVSASLTTSSLLKAAGVGADPAGTVAASVAVKWVLKDGIGSLGRLVVGVAGGEHIDEDPRLWRMAAEGVSTMGLAMEISAQLYPDAFLLLAGGGTLLRAVGRGVARPCSRVIQTHFSRGNVGDVAAKEELWEVVGQMTGLACSVALLHHLDDAPGPETVIGTWVAVHASHAWLRLKSLEQLRITSVNYKRAWALLEAQGRVPTPESCSAGESVLRLDGVLQPRVRIGCTRGEFLRCVGDEAAIARHAAASTRGYLAATDGQRGYVLLREGGTRLDRLAGLFHCYVLLQGRRGEWQDEAREYEAVAGLFDAFVAELEDKGWRVTDDNVHLLAGRTRWQLA